MKIFVIGDLTVDWRFIRDAAKSKFDEMTGTPGGASLVREMIAKFVEGNKDIQLLPQTEPIDKETQQKIKPKDVSTNWSMWGPVKGKQTRDGYRLFERGGYYKLKTGSSWDYMSGLSMVESDEYVVVLIDNNLGFRNSESLSEVVEICKRARHVFIKLHRFAKKDMKKGTATAERTTLEAILGSCENMGEKTTVFTTVDELRRCSVRIERSLSWERLFGDVIGAVHDPDCGFVKDNNSELRCARVIVTVDASGSVIAGHNGHNCLIFDRNGQEGDFIEETGGPVFGYSTCVLSTAISELVSKGQFSGKDGSASKGNGTPGSDSTEDDWCDAIEKGVRVARFLQSTGYLRECRDMGRDEEENCVLLPIHSLKAFYDALKKDDNRTWTHQSVKVWTTENGTESRSYGIDLERVNDVARFPEKCGSLFDPLVLKRNLSWSILSAIIPNGSDESPKFVRRDVLASKAIEVAQKGPNRDFLVPVERIGKWMSIDRGEIEGVRSVVNAFRNYKAGSNQSKKPLGVVMFGSPGAGKSFVIQEIASKLGIGDKAQLTFNLSQFHSADDLPGAFHQIRDMQLQGDIPLVFWDEFDTKLNGEEFGWLRYFLSPLQDGKFVEDGRVHPLGKGYYVFAGSTCSSYAQFCSKAKTNSAIKMTDFISRMSAYIDVKGPNGEPDFLHDEMFIMRRALLMNSLLKNEAPDIDLQNDVDQGVLEAFLDVGRFDHGARSIETIIKMSTIAEKKRYAFSSLPPGHILRMHVNSEDLVAVLGLHKTLRVILTDDECSGPKTEMEMEQAAPSSGVQQMWDDEVRSQVINQIAQSIKEQIYAIEAKEEGQKDQKHENKRERVLTLLADPVRLSEKSLCIARLLAESIKGAAVVAYSTTSKALLEDKLREKDSKDEQPPFISFEGKALLNNAIECIEIPPSDNIEWYCDYRLSLRDLRLVPCEGRPGEADPSRYQ